MCILYIFSSAKTKPNNKFACAIMLQYWDYYYNIKYYQYGSPPPPVIRVSQSPSDTEGKRKNGKRSEKNRNKKLLKRVPSYRERNPVFCLQLILCMDFGFLSDNVPHRIASYIEYFLQSYLLFCVLPLLFMKTYIYIYIRL